MTVDYKALILEYKFNYPLYLFTATIILHFLAFANPLLSIVSPELPFLTYSAQEIADLGEPIIMNLFIFSMILSIIVSLIFYLEGTQKYRLIGIYIIILKLFSDAVAFVEILNIRERLHNNDIDPNVILLGDDMTIGYGTYFLIFSFLLSITAMILEINYTNSIKKKLQSLN